MEGKQNSKTNMKVAILTARPTGQRCFDWAVKNKINECDIFLLHEGEDFSGYDVVVSVLYDKIIKKFYNNTRYYNFHTAILPEYAGTSTLSWILINKEKQSGITLHEMTPVVDAGKIISIERFEVLDDDTAETLNLKTQEHLFKMFCEWFPKIIKGEFSAVEQDLSKRRVYKRKELDQMKDLTHIVRALTFSGKERSFFTTRDGRKFSLDYEKGVIIENDK